ncbi:MAG: SAP domain-containing protein [Desulfuromonadaceae bacterium GWC2_58_13]|nr:MAG: SAP domain-containing protein [Desulfuromonadaceae bacterium GWC2_58_13]
MRLIEINNIAREKGLRPGRMKKDELIRAIQVREQHTPCFAAGMLGRCPHADCLWREDCR